MAGRILVLEQQPDAGADALGAHLAAAGHELVVIAVGEGGIIPDLADFDALIILGGEMNVWQEGEYPWLVDEKNAIRAWLAGPLKPSLGICLGHQLLADALGGEVGPRHAYEAGVRPVHLATQAAHDRLLGGLPTTFASLQWHGAEVRRVPAGAVVLAGNDQCRVQAMRIGTAAWGVQFHPEVGLPQAAAWGTSPRFRSLLEASEGPGAADRYPQVLDATSGALADATADIAAAFVRVLDGGTCASRNGYPPV